LQPTFEQQTQEFTILIRGFNKYIRVIKAKQNVGNELLEVVEKNLL
jgi:hypothetical protein